MSFAPTFYESYLGLTPTTNGYITDSGLQLPSTPIAPQSPAAPNTSSTLSSTLNPFDPNYWPNWFKQLLQNTPGIGAPIPIPGDNSDLSKKLAAPLNRVNDASGSAGATVGTILGTNPAAASARTDAVVMVGVILLGVLLLVLGVWSIVKD